MADRVKEILVIHHSHTDVGYTAQQSIVSGWNVDFIRQALSITEDRHDFRWTCETFWGVEQFLKAATGNELAGFAEAVKSGRIGLSANYLNFNELLDYDILRRMTSRAVSFGMNVGTPVDSAMTADINGFGQGFARALAESGVANLFTCIHTHHGMYPLSQRFLPFWWETTEGDRILVFNGEHYHFGNELGLVPGAVSSYIIKDECDAAMIFGDHWKVAEIRIPRFTEQLAASGYALPFVPVMASGLRTDNGPPNQEILDCIERWNRDHSDIVTVRMATLSDFFALLRGHSNNFESYSGDWPDWWSDGVASFPADTALFREAQRRYRECSRLADGSELESDSLESIRENLALYAEHTFSHADSVSRPWSLDVKGISSRKIAYAAKAFDDITAMVDLQHRKYGQASLRPRNGLFYRVLNSWDRPVTDYVALYVSHFEYHELRLDREVEIRSCADGSPVPHQRRPAPAGMEFVVRADLPAKTELDLEIIPLQETWHPYEDPAPTDRIATPATEIIWTIPEGITSWRDLSSGLNLLSPHAAYPPFAPIYELTPAPHQNDISRVRGEMVLNRKGANVVRSAGRLQSVRVEDDGPLFSTLMLDHALPGTSYCQIRLTVSKHDPRVDVVVRITKDQVWSPENLYLSLPFGPGSDNYTIWLDKSGAAIRPRMDQIPGTLTDFYCIQEGIAINNRRFGVAIATPDSPLVHLGDLEHRERVLHTGSERESNEDELYAWLMTNYWETNFAAGLGGFYEFRYALSWKIEFADPDNALNWCRSAFSGLKGIRLGKKGE